MSSSVPMSPARKRSEALVFLRMELNRMMKNAFSPLDRLGNSLQITEADGAKSQLRCTYTERLDEHPAFQNLSYELWRTQVQRSLRKSQPRMICCIGAALRVVQESENGLIGIEADVRSFSAAHPGAEPKLKMKLQFTLGYNGSSCGWHITDHSQMERAGVLVREAMHYLTAVRQDRNAA